MVARSCLCCVKLLQLSVDLFTMDQCSVILRAFCNIDDNCDVEFQTCLTRMAEKVYISVVWEFLQETNFLTHCFHGTIVHYSASEILQLHVVHLTDPVKIGKL